MDFPLTLRSAVALAYELEEIFKPACERFELAGSTRRNFTHHTRMPEASMIINDLELVAIPRMVQDPRALFAETSAVDLLIIDQRKAGLFAPDPDHNCDGERYKRFIYRSQAKVDLFLVAPPASWGATLAIRTGDKKFARLLVTSRQEGGAMPPGLRCKHGGLCQIAKHQGHDNDPCTSDCRIETETEVEFFQRLDLPLIPPQSRSERELLSTLARKRSSYVSPHSPSPSTR